MVQARKSSLALLATKFEFDDWYSQLQLPDDTYQAEVLARALDMSAVAELEAGVNSHGGWDKSAFHFGLQMAEILLAYKVDQNAFVAALLYRQVRKMRVSLEDVERQFGAQVATLIAGVQRMAMISQTSDDPTRSVLGQGANQAQAIRKMLVAIIDDVRIALIKLAERTVAIRVAKDEPQRRIKIAREVFNVYVPLAHRLGIGQLKWELEDLSFRYLEPDVYQQIAGLLSEKRVDRESFIDQVALQLTESLNDAGVNSEISGRVKHIFSIWRKMRSKAISFSEVYDIRAVRILVDKPHDCYAALGIVHLLWRSVPNEFDDYIANPKENGYRSLHTAVIGPGGRTLEVQIRTHSMHQEAEYGVCAHWVYKGSDSERSADNSYEEKIAWLRDVLQWSEDMQQSDGLGRQIRSQIVSDRVYVFTPEGHVVDLPRGATPIDFAYHVHTDVGHRCKGAKIDGRIVPLSYQLKTGEQIEIITGSQFSPSRDWMRDGLAYTRTARAKSKIRQWFKRQDSEDNEAAGQQLVEREFKRLALTSLDYSYVARKVNCQSVEAMYAAIGAGDIGLNQVLNAAQSILGTESPDFKPRIHDAERAEKAVGVQIGGVGNLLSHLAGCCKAVPGDPILGYVTQGRGVSIHRQDCGRMLSLVDKDPDRVIEVSWDGYDEYSYPVEIRVEAYDRRGLLSDVTGLLAAEKCNLTQVQTHTNKQANTVRIVITVEVDGLHSLASLLAKISMLKNVSSAERIVSG